jgi:hypothetical protein
VELDREQTPRQLLPSFIEVTGRIIHIYCGINWIWIERGGDVIEGRY